MIGMGIFVVWLLVALAGGGATVWLALLVWKRRRTVGLLTRLVAAVATALAAFALLGTVIGLFHAFGAIGGERVEPSEKARILAEGISEAMNATALLVLGSVPIALVLAVLLRRRKDRSQ